MSAYLIGRDDRAAQISIGEQYKRVSRRHAELSVIDAASCRLVDLDSANGTEVLDKERWQRVKKAVVSLDHRVRFGGEFEATVRDLLHMAAQRPLPHQSDASDKGRFGDARPPLSPQQNIKRAQDAAPPPVPDDFADGYGSAFAGAVKCFNCGQPLAGNFCANCGAGAAGPAPQGVVSMLRVEIGSPAGQGYFYTLARLLRSPVRSTIALAEERAYRGHKSFFLASSTVGIAVQSFVVLHDPSLANNPQMQQFIREYGEYYSVLLTAFQYVAIFGGFLLGYLLFKRFAPLPSRTAQEYFKLTCLSGGLSALLGAILNGIQFVGHASPHAMLWAGLATLPFALFMIHYGLKIQKLFWNISYPRVITLSLVLFVLIAMMVAAVSAAGVFAVALVITSTSGLL